MMYYLYSILLEVIYFFLLLLLPRKSKLFQQLNSRKSSLTLSNSGGRNAVFFVSSAGELEQAIPLCDQLKQLGIKSHIFVFSLSGIEFAKKTGIEYETYLAPIDSIFRWSSILDSLKPELVFVVRWEFWPTFLKLSSKYTKKVSCINVSFDISRMNLTKKTIYKFFFGYFSYLFTVEQRDYDIASQLCVEESSKVFLSGDTKYDRVVERAIVFSRKEDERLTAIVDWKSDKKLLIIGSGWKDDWELVLDTYFQNKNLIVDWKLIIAPHDLSDRNLSKLYEKIEALGLKYDVLSRSIKDMDSNIVVVDSIGLLAKLYRLSDVAFVGGGLHHRVHNVLEPSCFGKPVAFGPKCDTSQEAIKLLENKLSTVVDTNDALYNWWIELSDDSFRKALESKLIQYVDSLTGATSRILNTVVGEANDEKANYK